MFAWFAFFSIWGYRREYCNRGKEYRKKLIIITLLITSLYGGLTELLQAYLFIGRYGSVYDFIADVIGCILGIFIYVLVFRKKMIKKSSKIK